MALSGLCFRPRRAPRPGNGLRKLSQIIVDKPVTVRRERIGQRIGRLATEEIARLDVAIAFGMGLAD